jgi:hypothetical protein
LSEILLKLDQITAGARKVREHVINAMADRRVVATPEPQPSRPRKQKRSR